LLDKASASTDQADLVILAHVETIRDQEQPATPSAVASLIGGAPVRAVADRMLRLNQMGLIESVGDRNYGQQLTRFGSELLQRDLIGWSPSVREEGRRDAQLTRIINGSRRL
jgi:hypothetical protein